MGIATCWGLTASDIQGYTATHQNDLGVIAPTAAISFPTLYIRLNP